ncbi:MAG TPA: hypothetical protein VHL11_19200, partial [Phototrophicaceae bacterium]|nr:hypothetical protein [Phototrophicaceae bacterium]
MPKKWFFVTFLVGLMFSGVALAQTSAVASDVITRDNLYRLAEVAYVPFDEDKMPDALAWSPDSQRFALTSPAGIQIFDWTQSVETPLLALSAANENSFRCLAWSGTLIAASCTQNQSAIIVWNSETGEQIAALDGGDGSQIYSVGVIGFSLDGTRLAANNINDNSVRVWNIDTSTQPPAFQPLATLQTASDNDSGQNLTPRDLALSPDGKT